MENLIKEFLNKQNTIVIVGASNNPEKYGYKIFQDLKEFGYHVIPIHPTEQIVQGVTAYSTLTEMKQHDEQNEQQSSALWVINFVIPPEKTLAVLQECLTLGLKNVWFQPGSSDEKVLEYCEQNGFRFIHDQCVMIQKWTI
jgi:predicted CoA-binding protein